jgi:hypothetical protein
MPRTMMVDLTLNYEILFSTSISISYFYFTNETMTANPNWKFYIWSCSKSQNDTHAPQAFSLSTWTHRLISKKYMRVKCMKKNFYRLSDVSFSGLWFQKLESPHINTAMKSQVVGNFVCSKYNWVHEKTDIADQCLFNTFPEDNTFFF